MPTAYNPLRRAQPSSSHPPWSPVPSLPWHLVYLKITLREEVGTPALSPVGSLQGWTYRGDCKSYQFLSIAQAFPSSWPWPRKDEDTQAKRSAVYSSD